MKTLINQTWLIALNDSYGKATEVEFTKDKVVITQNEKVIAFTKEQFFDLKNIFESTKFIFNEQNK